MEDFRVSGYTGLTEFELHVVMPCKYVKCLMLSFSVVTRISYTRPYPFLGFLPYTLVLSPASVAKQHKTNPSIEANTYTTLYGRVLESRHAFLILATNSWISAYSHPIISSRRNRAKPSRLSFMNARL